MSEMSRLQSLSLINEYKNNPCLWDSTHELYTNKYARQDAYTKLLKTYKRYDESMTMSLMKKKIDMLRTNTRREHRKINKAKMNNRKHQTTLYYYEHLKFICEGRENLMDTEEDELNTSQDGISEINETLPETEEEPVVEYLYIEEDFIGNIVECTSTSYVQDEGDQSAINTIVLEDTNKPVDRPIKLLIKEYKKNPCLWDPTHERYKDKQEKQLAFERLFEMYKKYDPTLDMCKLRKRIQILRSCVKREYKKVIQAQIKNQNYVPSLYYYKDLEFICTIPSTVIKTEVPSDYIDEEMSQNETHYEYVDPTSPEETVIVKKEVPMEDFVVSTSDLAVTKLVEAESFGKLVGLQLGELHSEQRFIAQKMISEVIYYARLNRLNTNTKLALNM